TNTQPLLNQPYTLAGADQPLHADLALAAIPGLDAYRIVLVDGVFSEALSDLVPVAGLTVLPMEKAADELAFNKHFAEYADKTDNPFVALNTALFKSGVFISLAPNAVLDKPVHIIHVAAAETPLFTQVRNLYV